ncbi:MAG: hypothetical protein JNL32_06115 [Candidatus Kapabacteria bacterium]|nr:hypothetical protein [Candidatus Kapabacteria bacterium]
MNDGFDAGNRPVVILDAACLLTRHANTDTHTAALFAHIDTKSYNLILLNDSGRIPLPKTKYTVASARRDESCTCRLIEHHTGVCHRNSILPTIGTEQPVIAILSSDVSCCIARYADVIFARDNAAVYCNRHRIPHHTFAILFDILHVLQNQYGTGRAMFKRRRQAELQRKDAFESE